MGVSARPIAEVKMNDGTICFAISTAMWKTGKGLIWEFEGSMQRRCIKGHYYVVHQWPKHTIGFWLTRRP